MMFVKPLFCSRTRNSGLRSAAGVGCLLKEPVNRISNLTICLKTLCIVRSVRNHSENRLLQLVSCHGMKKWMEVVCLAWMLRRNLDIAGWSNTDPSTTQLGIYQLHSSQQLGKGRCLGKEGRQFNVTCLETGLHCSGHQDKTQLVKGNDILLHKGHSDTRLPLVTSETLHLKKSKFLYN